MYDLRGNWYYLELPRVPAERGAGLKAANNIVKIKTEQTKVDEQNGRLSDIQQISKSNEGATSSKCGSWVKIT